MRFLKFCCQSGCFYRSTCFGKVRIPHHALLNYGTDHSYSWTLRYCHRHYPERCLLLFEIQELLGRSEVWKSICLHLDPAQTYPAIHLNSSLVDSQSSIAVGIKGPKIK